MQTLLIVFSGTGNSLYIAKKLQKSLTDTDIVLLDKNTSLQNIQKYDKIGIISPLYYYKLPLFVKSFIHETSFPVNKYYFSIITRGIYPEGGALSQIKNIFKRKKLNMIYSRYITMPLNDITFYKPQDIITQQIVIEKANRKIELISKEIMLNKQIKEFEPLKLSSSLISNLFFRAPHVMDQNFNVDSTLCTKCALCESICPVQNITLSNVPKWNKNCEVCLRCYHYCPTHAIKYKQISSQLHNYTNPHITVSELIVKKT